MGNGRLGRRGLRKEVEEENSCSSSMSRRAAGASTRVSRCRAPRRPWLPSARYQLIGYPTFKNPDAIGTLGSSGGPTSDVPGGVRVGDTTVGWEGAARGGGGCPTAPLHKLRPRLIASVLLGLRTRSGTSTASTGRQSFYLIGALAVWADIWCQPQGQARGPWIRGAPLPLPVWGHYESPTLTVDTVEQYEELASSVELETQRLLRERRYDTVDNVLRFYRDFKKSGESSLEHFYRKYQPLIVNERHTCVGLGFELLRRLCSLNKKFPGIASGLYLVSCEETIGDIAGYVGGPPAADSGEKEHVLVCLKIEINKRRGIMLLDPGYHVARVITVMGDKLYPHTGWFTQSDDAEARKEYNYTLCQSDPDYVEWHERKTRPSALEQTQVALIYVARPYLTAIDVTERRNLVYNYRSLLARDFKGHLVAGIYFQVTADSPAFTIFHQTNREKKRIKISFSKFYDLNKIDLDSEESEIVVECARQMGLSQENLRELLSALASVLFDTSFTKQILAINAKINSLAKDN